MRLIAHSVMDELLLMFMMDVSACIFEKETDDDEWNEWIFDLMDDSDTEFFILKSIFRRRQSISFYELV